MNIEKLKIKYANQEIGDVCYTCGMKYSTRSEDGEGVVVTCHEANCEICNEITSVCSIRHYRNLDKLR